MDKNFDNLLNAFGSAPKKEICDKCKGLGSIIVANGDSDYDQEDCDNCLTEKEKTKAAVKMLQDFTNKNLTTVKLSQRIHQYNKKYVQ